MSLGPHGALEAAWVCVQDSTLQDCGDDGEVFRQRFRRFQYTDAAGPREAFNRLWELCCQWLKPRMRTLEQVLEQLVLEQFLTILPTEIETWVSTYGPENRESLLALIEDWQRENHLPDLQVDLSDLLFEELVPEEMLHLASNMQLESPELQEMGPVQGAPEADACIPQAGPQELNCGATGEYQPFLDPGFANPVSDCSRPQEQGEEPQAKELLGAQHVEQSPDPQRDAKVFPVGGLSTYCQELQPSLDTPPEEVLGLSLKPMHPLVPYATGKPLHPLGPHATGKPPFLAAHKLKNPEEKPKQCSQCEQCFACNQHLSTDMRIHTGEMCHKCPRCAKVFPHRSELDRNVRVHTGERSYECPLCHKHFSQGSHLNMHQKVHCRKDAYQCHKCSIWFASSASLTGHMKTHTPEKRHECHTCGKRFHRRTALTLHQRTHTEERPFSCQHCEKSYRQRSSLVIHLRVHTGEKPYACSQCSKRFMKKGGLIAHQAAHFREEFPENSQKAKKAEKAKKAQSREKAEKAESTEKTESAEKKAESTEKTEKAESTLQEMSPKQGNNTS